MPHNQKFLTYIKRFVDCGSSHEHNIPNSALVDLTSPTVHLLIYCLCLLTKQTTRAKSPYGCVSGHSFTNFHQYLP